MANDKLTTISHVETIEWAMNVLKTEINKEIVVQAPWSSALRINAGNELFYLKTTSELIASEAKIIQILHD